MIGGGVVAFLTVGAGIAWPIWGCEATALTDVRPIAGCGVGLTRPKAPLRERRRSTPVPRSCWWFCSCDGLTVGRPKRPAVTPAVLARRACLAAGATSASSSNSHRDQHHADVRKHLIGSPSTVWQNGFGLRANGNAVGDLTDAGGTGPPRKYERMGEVGDVPGPPALGAMRGRVALSRRGGVCGGGVPADDSDDSDAERARPWWLPAIGMGCDMAEGFERVVGELESWREEEIMQRERRQWERERSWVVGRAERWGSGGDSYSGGASRFAAVNGASFAPPSATRKTDSGDVNPSYLDQTLFTPHCHRKHVYISTLLSISLFFLSVLSDF